MGLESWDQWARERKLSWGNKKKEELVENKLGCPSSLMVSNSKGDSSSDFSLPDIQVLNIPGSVPALEVKRVCQNVGQLSKFRYYSMLREPGVKGLKQVIVNYVAAEHYKWAKPGRSMESSTLTCTVQTTRCSTVSSEP